MRGADPGTYARAGPPSAGRGPAQAGDAAGRWAERKGCRPRPPPRPCRTASSRACAGMTGAARAPARHLAMPTALYLLPSAHDAACNGPPAQDSRGSRVHECRKHASGGRCMGACAGPAPKESVSCSVMQYSKRRQRRRRRRHNGGRRFMGFPCCRQVRHVPLPLLPPWPA